MSQKDIIMDLNTTLRLVHFPGFTSPDQVLDFAALQQFLCWSGGKVMLVHGGPGSGKTELLDALAEQTFDYPILIDNLLELLAQNRPVSPGYSVRDAAWEIRQHYYRYEPLHTMYYDIEEPAGRSDSNGPASLLDKLVNRVGHAGDDGLAVPA